MYFSYTLSFIPYSKDFWLYREVNKIFIIWIWEIPGFNFPRAQVPIILMSGPQGAIWMIENDQKFSNCSQNLSTLDIQITLYTNHYDHLTLTPAKSLHIIPYSSVVQKWQRPAISPITAMWPAGYFPSHYWKLHITILEIIGCFSGNFFFKITG